MTADPPAGTPAPDRLDLPLDAHLHTDQSPDSAVPIDVYAARAVELGIAEICITDHVDFDPRDPAYRYTRFEDRERTVRSAAERWAKEGVVIRFGAELTYNRKWDGDVRDHLNKHRYDYVIGSVHDWPESPYWSSRVRSFIEGRSYEEILEPYYTEIIAAARTGLFDTIGHLDVVRRYLYPMITTADLATRPDLQEPALRALIETGTALEVNSSGLRYPGNETYPSAAVVARFRELGGEHVVAGSDAHSRGSFSAKLDTSYGHIEAAGFDSLAFRRGGERVRVRVPARTRQYP
ncbi:MAG TPA: histidinol-phosphatase HisJ family protein [Candidatus Limnocylindrales bacterium]|nr:histidinol-phosphatase HisJ family protein [Candidatus Limnocylindrales bacterium]